MSAANDSGSEKGSNGSLDPDLLKAIFPGGMEDLLCSKHKCHEADLNEVVLFVVMSDYLFETDKAYHWNLHDTMWASYNLASELLNNDMVRKTQLMIFFIALLQEYFARGPNEVRYWLNKLALWPDQSTPQKKEIFVKLFFSKFAYMNLAVANTLTRKNMSSFLTEGVATLYCGGVHYAVEVSPKPSYCTIPLHSFNIYGAIPEKCITIELPTIRGNIVIYNDTTLKWVFKYAMAFLNANFKLLNGTAKINLRQWPGLNFTKFKDNGDPSDGNVELMLFFGSSGDKTIRELGVQSGDALRVSHKKLVAASAVDRHDNRAAVKKKFNKINCNKRECAQAGPPNQTTSKHELSLDDLREIHSKEMGPVLEELGPQLKAIRDRLNSLKLKKEHPKARRGNMIAVGKESSITDTVPTQDFLGKAGKSVHPIFVGETANLYKTRLLQSKRTSHVTVLDLHGCSKAEARDMRFHL